MFLREHQQRVVNELEELDDRLRKLMAFMRGEVFAALPAAERDRMARQAKVMGEYAGILGERIAAFE